MNFIDTVRKNRKELYDICMRAAQYETKYERHNECGLVALGMEGRESYDELLLIEDTYKNFDSLSFEHKEIFYQLTSDALHDARNIYLAISAYIPDNKFIEFEVEDLGFPVNFPSPERKCSSV